MKRRLISSYAAQAYIGLIGILLMPMYMRHMGIEAVALIGFFLIMTPLVRSFMRGARRPA